jgi:MFS family permease
MDETVQTNNNQAAKVITSAALSSIFIYSLVVSLPAILINEVVDAFSLQGTDEGLMGSLTSLGFMIALFITILVQGRVKKITILIAAPAVQALMLFFSGFSPTFILFCIGCTFIGFSGGFIDSTANSAIVDVRKHEGTKYLGYLHGLFGVGSLSAPLIFIWVQRYIDWRGIHYSLAVASLAVVVLVFILTRKSKNVQAKQTEREHLFTKKDLLAYLRIRRNVALSLAGFFAMFAIACTTIWIVRYMTLRYNAAELGVLSISVYWVCSTLNRFFLTNFIKRAPMKFFALGAALSTVSLLIGIFSGSPVILCVMMGVFGLCSGHFIPVLVSECAIGYEGRTTFTTSFLMFVMCIARIVSPLMIAFVSTQISLTLGMMLPVTAALMTMICGWFAKQDI